ncbi:MAG: nucleotide exchange factor GrpE [Coriobacteriia bacterium]|nr:nucleotide exchange factor GrpE [Coriobacteriia bacterium]
MADDERALDSAVPDEFDPELADDLGAELEFRGDVMEDEIESARAEAADWRDKATRAQADFENTRKRLETRHQDALLRAGERIVEALFPVLDDLDRAIDHAVGDGSDITEGLDAVRRKLLDVLVREGCTPIDPFGQPFDPNRHQAVQMQESLEVADHTVVDVFQKGYEMHGRVLRPAMVVVSTGGPAGE